MEGLSEVKPKVEEEATGADGKLIKMEEDWSDRVRKGLEEAEKTLKTGKAAKLTQVIEALEKLEKGSRLSGDSRSNKEVILAMVEMTKGVGEWSRLNDLLHLISKKRSLIKQSITAMVEKAASFVDDTPDLPTKLALIDTLRKVTDGKIYVEVQRARLTYKLVKMKEAEGKLDEAATLLLDLQIETYGTMERKEKVEMLLEQMRLSLARKDFTRAQIISRKISTKFFASEELEIQALKIRFYKMMIEVDLHHEDFLPVSRHFSALNATPKVAADRTKMEETLKCALLYCVLAPHAPDQSSELHRLKALRALERLSDYKQVADLLTTAEMIQWEEEMEAGLGKSLRSGPQATDVFKAASGKGDSNWDLLHTRVAQHNIRVIAKNYSRISLATMAKLLAWPQDKTEEFLCKAVTEGTVTAKIDRPSGEVSFRSQPSQAASLDAWAQDLATLMDKLNHASHLIQKEEMVHKHLYKHAHTT